MNGFKEKVIRKIIRLGKKNHSLRMPALALSALFLVAYHSVRSFFLEFRYHPIRQRILVGILVLSLLAGQIGIVNVFAESKGGMTKIVEDTGDGGAGNTESRTVSNFLELPDDIREQAVPVGTALEELVLPDTLEAVCVRNNHSENTLAEGVSLPQITVTVQEAADSGEIELLIHPYDEENSSDMVYSENVHTHKVCGNSSHADCTHDEEIEFEPFPKDASNLRGKSYYLTEDIELVSSWELVEKEGDRYRLFVQGGVTNICLNGWSIRKDGGQIIDINEIDGQYAELNICDCKGGGKIENTSAVNGYACISVIDASTLNLYGGTVDGGVRGVGIEIENNSSGGIEQGGTANIYGGVIETNEGTAIWLSDPDTSLSVYGGEISSLEYYAISADGERSTVSICGGKVTGSAENYDTLAISGQGAHGTISGGSVISQKDTAASCFNGDLKITGGEVKSESSTSWTVFNADTLVVSGGIISCGGYYGIYNNYDGKATISGGEINSAGSAIYNTEGGEIKIEGGDIRSENYYAVYNEGSLKASSGKITAGYKLLWNKSNGIAEIDGGEFISEVKDNDCVYNQGSLTVSGGKITGKGAYTIQNAENADLKISGGTIEAESYLLYNLKGGRASISGGKLTGVKTCLWNNGTLDILNGEITSEAYSPVVNNGTLSISGGSFGAKNSRDAKYIQNKGVLNLSGSPEFNNTRLWLSTSDNIRITGELTYSEPCAVNIDSTVPRIFTSGWSAYMGEKNPYDYFKSPYSLCTVGESDGEALLRLFMITFNANGGTCETSNTSVNDDGKALLLPEATRNNYTFDGWFTAAENGEKVTADTVFTADTTVYAHWTGCDHIWSDTYEYDNNQHWKVCTKCNEADVKIDHIWDGGTVTTPSTEETEGVRTYTCTVCAATKTEGIEMLPHTHTYSDKWTSSDTSHWHAAACGHDVVSGQAAHSEDNGTVTVPPTYENAGAKTFACTVCGYVMRTEKIPQLEEEHIHNFSPDWIHDSTNHWHECDCGEKSELANHISSDWIVKTPATTNLEGVQIKNCMICGIELDRSTIDKLPNSGDSGSSGDNGNGGSDDNDDSSDNNGDNTPGDNNEPSTPAVTPPPVTPPADTPQPVPRTEGSPDKITETQQPEGASNQQPEGSSEQDSSHPTQTDNKPQTESEAVQTVQAKAADGRIVISGETVATGNLTENSETTTLLEVGDGAVIVTVFCEDEGYAAGVKDTVAVANAVLMPEQIQLVSDGETIEIRIDVKDISETVAGQDKEVIESGLTEYRKEIPELTLGMYVDISMFIRIGEGDWDAVTATKEPIEVIIGIPEELREDGREFYIIRSHEGEYTLLNDMDNAPDTITISTDMFSAYAIAYRQTDTDNAQSENVKCRLCHICPTFLGICYFIWLAVIIIVIIVLRKKKDEE